MFDLDLEADRFRDSNGHLVLKKGFNTHNLWYVVKWLCSFWDTLKMWLSSRSSTWPLAIHNPNPLSVHLALCIETRCPLSPQVWLILWSVVEVLVYEKQGRFLLGLNQPVSQRLQGKQQSSVCHYTHMFKTSQHLRAEDALELQLRWGVNHCIVFVKMAVCVNCLLGKSGVLKCSYHVKSFAICLTTCHYTGDYTFLYSPNV